MNIRETLIYQLINSPIMKIGALTAIINRTMNFIRIIKALMGLKSSFVGQTRLVYRALHQFKNGAEKVRILPDGIEADGKVISMGHIHILEFIPQSGVELPCNKVSSIRDAIIKAVYQKDPSITVKYYRLRALFQLVTLAYLICILFLIYKIISQSTVYSFPQKLCEFLWMASSIYFFTQTLLFYRSRLKHFSMKISFVEANTEEEKALKSSEKQPYVIAVVPTYMEEPSLLKRTLYSLCLQSYRNLHVVMLLGNDAFSRDDEVQNNTKQMRRMIAGIKAELRKHQQTIREQSLKFYTSMPADKNRLSIEYENIGKLLGDTAKWFIQKAREFAADSASYPTDKFFIRHSLVYWYMYFKRRSIRCLKKANSLTSGLKPLESDTSDDLHVIEEYYRELGDVFGKTLEVFMRTKYENLEQEKTKAGNLTAYCSLIGQNWINKKQPSGKIILIPCAEGKPVNEPEYLVSFDSDTIAKPDYILRKIVFMEKKENNKVGLIQSPYVVPSPEKTSVASASGIHSYWFLPVSVALSSFKSAYWLGFNAVMRYEAVKKIKSFLTDTVIEDTQNSIKLKQAGYEIITSAEEQCITFSPDSLDSLKKQRIRWACGGFKIAKDLIVSMWRKKSGLNGFREKILGLNYVLGLNILPIAVTSMYILESPFGRQYYFIETLPFFLYLISYVSLLKSLTGYRWKHMIDGLAVSTFLNIYHLAGTVKSLKNLFINEKSRIFKPTPRGKKNSGQKLGNLEYFGVYLIIVWFGLRLTNQILNHVYYDIFPLYQLILALYGVKRFCSRDADAKKEVEKKKHLIRSAATDAVSNGFTGIFSKFHKVNYVGLLKIAFIIAGVAILSIAPMKKVNDLILLNNIRKEVMLDLYDSRSLRAPLNPFDQAKRLGKGLNIGNVYEVPMRGGWKLNLPKEYFKIIKDAGFDTVRIPVGWPYHVSKESCYTIDETFFQNIDWILLTAKKYHLNTVLVYYYDFRSSDGIYCEPQKNYEIFINVWKQIAKRYKKCDSSVYYELLNEPHGNLTSKIWNDLLSKTIDEIRKIDSYHTIVLTAADWGTAYGLKDLMIPAKESNIVCSFHTYTPVLFTHQGVTYAEEEYKSVKGLVWPGPPKETFEVPEELEENNSIKEWLEYYNIMPYKYNPGGPEPILKELDIAYDWGKKNKRPIWLGEFGVTTNADNKSRINWTNFITSEAEKRGMTWAYWDFCTSCKVYDLKKKQWDEGLLKTLIH
ncbi:MAG: cellulase family glycosylhydrolase [Bacillota bacterium]|nr:cellulase family glycosylhydrolase [Bacillota bacterium]